MYRHRSTMRGEDIERLLALPKSGPIRKLLYMGVWF